MPGPQTAGRILTAVVLACVIEGALVVLIATKPPDPPLGIGDALLLGSQFPGLFLGSVLIKVFRIPPTNAYIWWCLFAAQMPFYGGLFYWLLRFRFHRYKPHRL